MKIPKEIRSLFNKYDSLKVPVVFYGGKMVSLVTCKEKSPFRFGGSLPEFAGDHKLDSHRLVLTLDLESLPIKLKKSDKVSRDLHLVYDFDMISGMSTYYTASRKVMRMDESRYNAVRESLRKDGDFPFEGYPAQFKEVNLSIGLRADIEFDLFQDLCTSQGLHDGDDKIYVLFPPYKKLRQSVWGEGGDSEGVMCVFAIEAKTGYVDAQNQCT